jgi:hypothetical protein
MSVAATKKKKKAPQKFIRLNLDEALEAMLREYEVKYKLLSRSDIIRMLLSEIYWEKKLDDRQKLTSFFAGLFQPEVRLSEEEMFAELSQHNLM